MTCQPKMLFEILTPAKAAVILDASLGSATEVVLQSLSVHKRVVAIPYPDFFYIFSSIFVSILLSATIQTKH